MTEKIQIGELAFTVRQVAPDAFAVEIVAHGVGLIGKCTANDLRRLSIRMKTHSEQGEPQPSELLKS